jgi:K+-transporting ATPase ATPase A chain
VPFYNSTLGVEMLLARFLPIVATLALAGALAKKQTVPASAATLPTNGPLFTGLLTGIVFIVGGLTFFPALALGPIVEHFIANNGTLF